MKAPHLLVNVGLFSVKQLCRLALPLCKHIRNHFLSPTSTESGSVSVCGAIYQAVEKLFSVLLRSGKTFLLLLIYQILTFVRMSISSFSIA